MVIKIKNCTSLVIGENMAQQNLDTSIHIESGAQLLVRLNSQLRPTIQNLCHDFFPDGGPHPKKIIEICGDSNSGKRMLLMEVLARSLLPSLYGGKDCDTLLINIDQKFSLLQLIKILERIITNSGEHVSDDEVKDVIEVSLNHLNIINCYSSDEFEIALHSLDQILFNNKEMSLVVIESVGSFYWINTHENKQIKMENHYKRIVAKLKTIADENRIVVAYKLPSFYCAKMKSKFTLADYKFDLSITNKVNENIASVNVKMIHGGRFYEKQMGLSEFGVRLI